MTQIDCILDSFGKLHARSISAIVVLSPIVDTDLFATFEQQHSCTGAGVKEIISGHFAMVLFGTQTTQNGLSRMSLIISMYSEFSPFKPFRCIRF